VFGLIVWLAASARGQAPAHPNEDRDNGPAAGNGPAARAEIAAAQTQFYSGRYEAAAAAALVHIHADSRNLAAHELRSTALLFRVKSLIPPETEDKARAFRACAACPGLVAAFDTATRAGIEAARDALRVDAASTEAQFFLGKLHLNHVWLYLGTLGRRTGWNEYWEGRRAIEAVLARDPRHLRAHVAHAWIDYIVATRMAPGTRWILGGGNKKRAIAAMREAVARGDNSFAGVEARFALWELHVREKNLDDALRSARMLVKDFPDNSDLLAFLDKHDRGSKQ
jgi:hypothetical protein